MGPTATVAITERASGRPQEERGEYHA